MVIPRLACFSHIQFAIGNQLRLPGIVDGGSRRCCGGYQISGNRTHYLVIDSDLPTMGGIVLSVVLALVGNKGPILQRLACDLGRLTQNYGPGGDIRNLGKWF